MFVTVVFLSICPFGLVFSSDTSIKWDVNNEYVIYGEDTTLTCNGRTCAPHSGKQWFGGPDYNLLCTEDFTANPFKYKMVVKSTSPNFDLMIKNFTFNDANCEYTCVCGIQQYTKMLKLNESDFIYPPDVDEDILQVTESQIQMNILMKVYPLPICVIEHQTMVLPLNITNYTTMYIPPEGHFSLYEVWIQQILAMNHFICSGTLNLTCKVGSKNFTLIEKRIDVCYKDYNDVFRIVVVIAGILGLICILCAWFIIKHKIMTKGNFNCIFIKTPHRKAKRHNKEIKNLANPECYALQALQAFDKDDHG